MLYAYFAIVLLNFDLCPEITKMTPDDLPTNKFKEAYKTFLALLEKSPKIQQLKKILSNKKEISKTTLQSLLFLFNPEFINLLKVVSKDIIKNDLLQNISFKENPNENLEKIITQTDSKKLDILGEAVNKQIEQFDLIAAYNYYSKNNNNQSPDLAENTQNGYIKTVLSFHTFHTFYTNAVESSIYDEYYVACFSEKKDDSTMWGHYAEGHQGICLVFEIDIKDTGSQLFMDNGRKIDFLKVNYTDDPLNINIFENMGYIPIPKLNKYWLTHDEDISPLSSFYSNSEYPKKYWERYTKKTTLKSTHWFRENEYRAVMNLSLLDKQKLKPSARILKYDISQLTGIIFGMRTPEQIKLDLIKALDEILSKSQKQSFKFYQAGYETKNNQLTISELTLIKLS